MTISFDGATKLATLSAGTTTLNVADLWSRWCDWYASHANWAPAMLQVGGNVIDAGAGTAIPAYIYLIDGWRVKPQEANHTLNVSGGVLLVEGGGDPFVATTGSYVVRINYSQPVQAITVSTGGGAAPSAADNAAAVWAKVLEGVSAEEMMRIMLAALAGKRQGLGTATEQYMGQDGVTPRITLTPDVNGNGTPTLNGAP